MFKELEKKLKAKLKKEQNELVSATTQLIMKGIDYIMEVNVWQRLPLTCLTRRFGKEG